MAWNPEPEVAAARDFGRKFDGEQVVILYVTSRGQLGAVSYGRTRELCADAKKWADRMYEDALDYHVLGNEKPT